MIRHIATLQRFIHNYEQSTNNPLQFLSSKTIHLPQLHLALHNSLLSVTESLNKEDVMESLSAIKITERGNRRVGNDEHLLKMMSGPAFHQCFTLTSVDGCYHIHRVISDRVWVSGKNNIIQTNSTGVTLNQLEDVTIGIHTVNNENELIYIDGSFQIKKLSKDMKTTTTIIEKTDSKWKPVCLYLSPTTGDLLVGEHKKEPDTKVEEITIFKLTGKVTRYNYSGRLIQTISKEELKYDFWPFSVTDNNNGDVVVTCLFGLIVTDRAGRFRFSYPKYPS